MDRGLGEVISSVYMFVGNNIYNGNLKTTLYYLTVARVVGGLTGRLARTNWLIWDQG